MPAPANNASEVSAAFPPRPRRWAVLLSVLIVSAWLVPALVVHLSQGSPPASRLRWLTPTQLARALQPSPLTRLAYKVMNLTAPLWRWYWVGGPRIVIDSKLLVLSRRAGLRTALGAPMTTNADGSLGWILFAAQSRAMRQRLTTMPGAVILASPRMMIGSRIQGEFDVGKTVTTAGGPVFAGLAVKVAPRKVAAGSIQLLLSVVVTEEVPSPAPGTVHVRTNFTSGWRAQLPAAGSLVIDARDADRCGGSNHWFLLSVTAVDAHGRPITP